MEFQANAKVKAVFQSALERETLAERSAYLDEACAGDATIRQRVDALLHAHETPDPLLDHTAAELIEAQGDDEVDAGEWLDFLGPPTKAGSLGRLGHYEVLEVAGRGGMGVVFRAFDDKLHRVVAVKALAPALAASPEARQQFVREARAAAAITHENVISIYAVEESDGPVPYLVMQFVQGVSLQQKIEAAGPLPLHAILRIALHAAEGLAAAHRQGLVHRDVKPANILLENGVERVKITDFGLALAGGDASTTHPGLLTGTPTYMSPEQALGERVDARSDLFSLGSVMYAMCTGKPPFDGPSALAVLKRVCEESPPPVRRLNAELPAWLEQLVSSLHAKNPAERPASARDVADVLAKRLAEIQEGAAVHGTPATPGPWRRRGLRAAAIVALVLAGVGLAEATGVTRIRNALSRAAGGEIKHGSINVPGLSTNPVGVEQDASNAWERGVAALPPDERVRAVAARLKEVNPGFDGQVAHKAADQFVTELQFLSEHVSDISPVRALPHLRALFCYGLPSSPGVLSDLTPLRGMRITQLKCQHTRVSDLSPLKGMPLTSLECPNTSVADLSPLAGSPLTYLDCQNSLVSDLSPLAGLPLTQLIVSNTRVSDLSPLRGMRLNALIAEQLEVSDLSPLRGMPLTYVGLYRTRVSDLSPLRGMALTYLNLTAAPVSDLSLLKEMKTLRGLVLDEVPMANLSLLRGLPLETLQITRTGVTDLSPLEGMPLKRICLDFHAPRDSRVLRSLPKLQIINDRPAADFLRENAQ